MTMIRKTNINIRPLRMKYSYPWCLQSGKLYHDDYTVIITKSLSQKSGTLSFKTESQGPAKRNHNEERLELIKLNVFPMTGPRTINATITTRATKTRIKAYSTNPCPFSNTNGSKVFTSFPA
jgi:hypothetical protein